MKKRLLGILLSLMLMLTMMPMMTLTAFAVSAAIYLGDGGSNAGDGSTWSYVASTQTLTLSGFTGTGNYDYGIYYEGTNDLNIVLSETNTVNGELYGVYNYGKGDIIISGQGTLAATGQYKGIHFENNEAELKIESGNVTAEATTTITTGSACGIYAKQITINNGTVIATGNPNNTTISVGIQSNLVTINGGDVTACGSNWAIYGSVINKIAGTAWTNTAGSAGETPIAINKEGQDWRIAPFNTYKKVNFKAEPEPTPPTPTPTPTPAPTINVPVISTTASGSRNMTVNWNKFSGAKSYKVSYRKVGSSKWTTRSTKKTKYVIKGHKTRGLYEYKVGAVTDTGTVWSKVNHRYYKGTSAYVRAGKGTIKVKWSKDKKATGYQVLIATNKKMNGAQVIDVPATSRSYTFNGLEKGRYYVKVRPMKTYGGITYKGRLTSVRSAKVK